MSWLGNGLSNITGQISTFTREVLTEGTEEIDDAATELRISSSKLQALEQNIQQQKAENDRLRKAYEEVCEKLESSELQNNALAQEYRARIDQQEKALSKLKEREHEWATSHYQGGRDGRGGGGGESAVPPPVSQESTDQQRQRLQQLEADNAALQQQVRQLTGDVTSKASSHSADEDEENAHHSSAQVAKLNACIKALRHQLEEEAVQNQQALAQAQQLHSQKLAQLRKKHKDDIRKYEDQIGELQDLLDVEGDEEGTAGVHLSQLSALREREKELEEQMYKQSIDLEQTHAADRQKADLLERERQERAKAEEHGKHLSEQLELLRQTHSDLLSELDEVNVERDNLLVRLADKPSQHPTSTPFKHPQPALNFDANVSQLETENAQLEEQVRALSEQVTRHEREREQIDADWQSEKEAMEDLLMSLRAELREKDGALNVLEAEKKNDDDNAEEESKSSAAAAQTKARPAHKRIKKQGLRVAQQLQEENDREDDDDDEEAEDYAEELQQQVDELTEGSAQLENERDILTAEKKLLHDQNSALRQEVNELKQQLLQAQQLQPTDDDDEDAENSVAEVSMLQEELAEKGAVLEERTRDLESKETELEELMTSMEELDSQHQEAIAQMISSRNKLQEHNQTLEQNYKALQEEMMKTQETQEEMREKNNAVEEEQKRKSQEALEERDEEIRKLCQELNHQKHLKQEELAQKQKEIAQKEKEKADMIRGAEEEKQVNRTQIEELRAECTKLDEDLSVVKSQCPHGMDSNERIIRENKKMKEEIQELRKKNEKAGMSLNDLAMESLDEKDVNEEKVEDVQEQLEELQSELDSSRSHCEMLQHELSDFMKGSDEASEKQLKLSMQVEELQEQKQILEKDVAQLEQKLHDQAKHYQSYIKDLESARDLNSSGLQQQLEDAMKQCHEKDRRCMELEEQVQEANGNLDDAKEMLHSTMDDQKGIGGMLDDKEAEITNLNQAQMKLEEEVETMTMTIKAHEAELARLAEVEQKYHVLCEEKKKLNATVEKLQEKISQHESTEETVQIESRTLDIITDLEGEITQLKKTIERKDERIEELKKTIERKDVHIEEQKKTISALKQTVVEREESLVELNEKSSREAKETATEIHLREEKIRQLLEESNNGGVQMNGDRHGQQNGGTSSSSSPSRFGSPGKQDTLIAELQEKHACLQKMLDEQITQAREETAGLRREKEQMMTIVTEKSRECSQLKSEVHRLMNIVSAEKTALSKLQQDNSELRQKQEGPNNDMTKEAVKKLSAMIRDKDMEIEALTQKNTSLLQVLQESGQHGSVLANLIQERDNLHKQVGLFQADREQIIQALNAKHSESLMYHGEIQRLNALISTETEQKDKLQQEYSNLVQQYEDKQQGLLNAQNEILNYKQKLVEVDNRYKEMLQQQQMQMSQSSSEENDVATRREERELSEARRTAQQQSEQVQTEQSDEHLQVLVQREQVLQQQVQSLQQQVQHLQDRLQQREVKGVTGSAESDAVEEDGQENTTEEVKEKEIQPKVTVQQQQASPPTTSASSTTTITTCNQHQEEIDGLHGIIASHEQAFAQKDRIIADRDQTIRNKDKMIAQHVETASKQQHTLNDKDKALGELNVRFHKTEQMLRTRDTEIGTLNKKIEKVSFHLKGTETELKHVTEDRDRLQERIPMLEQESAMLKEANNKLSMSVNDKDFEINALKEKSNTLGKLLSDKRSVGEEKGEMDRLMKETETLHQQAQAFKQDRDQFILALQQQQGENAELKLKFHTISEEKQKLAREVMRLREHLLAVEEGYTREALEAEDREKDLRTRLATAQERALHANTSVQNASSEAAQLVAGLRREISEVCEQRDGALLQLSSAQEQAIQYATQLQNLQAVLEQFQHEREVAQAAEVERCEREVLRLRAENVAVVGEMRSLQAQLAESVEAVEAAHRLSDQLDRKEELISALREEVQSREQQISNFEHEVNRLKSATEAKVEKTLMKNLLTGYFHTKKKADALSVIGHVLDMTDQELQELGAEAGGSGWLGGLWNRTKSLPGTPKKAAPARGNAMDKSFSEMFIKYLERESTPAPEVVRLNTEQMIQEQNAKKGPAFNPFMAPIPTSQAGDIGGGRGGNLMTSSASTATLPVFPSHILKEVLK